MFNKLIFVASNLDGIGGVEKTAVELEAICNKKELIYKKLTLFSSDSGHLSITNKTFFFTVFNAVFGKNISFFIWTYMFFIKNKSLKSILDGGVVVVRNVSMAYALILLKKKLSINCKLVYLPSHFSDDFYEPIINIAKKDYDLISLIKNKRHLLSEVFFEKKVLEDIDSEVVTFSYNLLNRLKSNYEVNYNKVIRVLRPGVSDFVLKETSEEKSHSETINYLYVGRVEPGKNVDRLLELLNSTKVKNWRLKVVGSGSLLINFQELYLHNSNIEFLGGKTGEELVKEYFAASYLILPTYKESYGHVISESLCCGTPVIGFDFVGCRNAIKELISHGDNGLIIKGDTQQDFDEILLEAKQNADFFNVNNELISRAARIKFSWEEFLANLIK